ncbi:MAG: hypothetical protein GWO07_10455 [Candidatus Dadabacteria bacterium]|nr:hypothetical protein [Candidatus Dadabacteria bacterium]NIS09165.1 hypothetical protein [Candidatus Dadabacteria bacterium]NIY22472.1 hypothetical protein [Candidatus Dadabacteria bacterium]
MDKSHIIHEIKRIATKNGGKPPGRKLFQKETGIKRSDWYPNIWHRWGDALKDAGYEPNIFTSKYNSRYIIEKYIELIVDGSIGQKGGYRLARQPNEITLLDVIEAIEGKNRLSFAQR